MSPSVFPSAPDGDRLPPRYQDVTSVGRGSFGRVLKATLEGHGPVAVKVLDTGLTARPELQWAFEEEARRLARFDHPGLPRLFDSGHTEAGNPYFAMAWVAGEPSRGPLSPSVVREMLTAIAGVLVYLHGLGYVHGDLKLENVLVSDEAGLKVLDLGLAARIGQPREQIAGTLEYLAPEVIRRAPVAPAADLYALGVLAYALRTGALPFSGPPAALVEAHLRMPVAPPRAEIPDAELDALILALLAKEPSGRPPSARAVLARLGTGTDPGQFERSLDPGAFVGRDDVLAHWHETLTTSDGARTLALIGERGLGKSRALDECRLAATVAGSRWASATCQGHGDAPGAPLRAVVAQALALASAPVPPRVLAWIRGEVPQDVMALEPASRRAVLLAAAAEALVAAATMLKGLAIGLDDWHLADAASVDALKLFQRQSALAPIVWAITSAEPLSVAGPSVKLGPFDRALAEAWLTSRLGTAAPSDLLDDLLQASAGVPAALDTMLEDAVAGGALTATSAGWRYDAASRGRLQTGLTTAWQARLASLSAPALELATWLALALPAGAVGAWHFAAVLAQPDLAASADALTARGIASAREGTLRLMPSVPVELLLEARQPAWIAASRSTLARRLAEADDAGQPGAAVGFDVALGAARLALEGDDRALALSLASAVAARCLAIVAPAPALELADRALARLEGGAEAPVRLELRYIQAEAARLLDRPGEAVAGYEQVLSAAGYGDRPASAAIGLAKCRQLLGDYAGAQAALSQVPGLTEAPELLARGALAEARLALFRNEIETALLQADQAIANARAAGHSSLLAQALTLRGILGVQHSPAEGAAYVGMIEEALALGQQVGDSVAIGTMLDNLGNAHLGLGELEQAAWAFQRYAEQAEASGAETELLSARLNQARVAADRGETQRAAALASEAARRARQAGRKMPEGLALGVASQAAWRAGDLVGAERFLSDALAVAKSLDNAYMRSYLELFALDLALVRGDLKAAVTAAQATASAAGSAPELGRRLAVARAELALRQGELAAARALAEPFAAFADKWVAHRALVVLAECALGTGDAAAASAQAGAARAIARAWQSPWHEAGDSLIEATAALMASNPDANSSLARVAAEAEAARNPLALVRAVAVLPAGAELDPPLKERAGEAFGALTEGFGAQARATFVATWGLTAFGAGAGGTQSGFDTLTVMRAFDEVADAVGESAIAAAVLRGAMTLMAADRGYLLVYQEGRLSRVITHGLDYNEELAAGFSHTIAERALYAAEPIYLQDASADEQWQSAASVMALGLKSVVAMPLATAASILGVLYIDRAEPEPFLSAADLAVLGALAKVGARALADHERLTELQREVSQQAAHAELAARLLRTPAPERQRQLLAALTAASGAARALRLRRTAGVWLAPDQPAGRLPNDISLGIADWVQRERQPLGLLDVANQESWSERSSVQALGLRTLWCLALPGEDGVLYLDVEAAEMDVSAARLAHLQALVDFAWPLTQAP